MWRCKQKLSGETGDLGVSHKVLISCNHNVPDEAIMRLPASSQCTSAALGYEMGLTLTFLLILLVSSKLN